MVRGVKGTSKRKKKDVPAFYFLYLQNKSRFEKDSKSQSWWKNHVKRYWDKLDPEKQKYYWDKQDKLKKKIPSRRENCKLPPGKRCHPGPKWLIDRVAGNDADLKRKIMSDYQRKRRNGDKTCYTRKELSEAGAPNYILEMACDYSKKQMTKKERIAFEKTLGKRRLGKSNAAKERKIERSGKPKQEREWLIVASKIEKIYRAIESDDQVTYANIAGKLQRIIDLYTDWLKKGNHPSLAVRNTWKGHAKYSALAVECGLPLLKMVEFKNKGNSIPMNDLFLGAIVFDGRIPSMKKGFLMHKYITLVDWEKMIYEDFLGTENHWSLIQVLLDLQEKDVDVLKTYQELLDQENPSSPKVWLKDIEFISKYLNRQISELHWPYLGKIQNQVEVWRVLVHYYCRGLIKPRSGRNKLSYLINDKTRQIIYQDILSMDWEKRSVADFLKSKDYDTLVDDIEYWMEPNPAFADIPPIKEVSFPHTEYLNSNLSEEELNRRKKWLNTRPKGFLLSNKK